MREVWSSTVKKEVMEYNVDSSIIGTESWYNPVSAKYNQCELGYL